MKYRQQFECWRCNKQFSYPLPKQKVASFIVECPFCHAEATIELSEIPKSRSMLRLGGDSGSNGSGHFSSGHDWPDLIKIKPDKT